MSVGQDELTAALPKRRRTRRSWSRAEKRRIIAEAFRPGASAADVARGYGLNANQLFNWRRALAVPAKSKERFGSEGINGSLGGLRRRDSYAGWHHRGDGR